VLTLEDGRAVQRELQLGARGSVALAGGAPEPAVAVSGGLAEGAVVLRGTVGALRAGTALRLAAAGGAASAAATGAAAAASAPAPAR
jgi:hypothetical protein